MTTSTTEAVHAVSTEAGAARLGGGFASSIISRVTVRNALPVVIALAIGLFIVPAFLSSFWVKVLTQVVYYSIMAGGLVLLYGRVGLASLGQFALSGVGAWVTARLFFATGWPLPILLLVAGVVTAVIGLLVGLPALRLSGLYLSLVTLMTAAAVGILINILKFPNGGPGFSGVVKDLANRKVVARPGIATGDVAFLRYTVIVAALMFGLYVLHLVSKPGRAWASIAQSEASALAAGVNTTVYKLWAFVLVSFATGVAGGLLAVDVGTLSSSNFPAQESLILMAVVIMAGYHSLWGGLVAGLLARLLPELLKNKDSAFGWVVRRVHGDFKGVSATIGLILFGVGLLLNLVMSTRAMKKKGLIS
jgi:branched-chain amino acid transport system permease protein